MKISEKHQTTMVQLNETKPDVNANTIENGEPETKFEKPLKSVFEQNETVQPIVKNGKPSQEPINESETKNNEEEKSPETKDDVNKNAKKAEKEKRERKISNSEPESDQAFKPPSQFSLGVFFIKFIVILYDILTFPIYYFLHRPWTKLNKTRKTRAVLKDAYDPYSPYVRVYENFDNHYAFKAQTIPESQQLVLKLNPKTLPILGKRNIVNVYTETNKEGKKFMKYELTDYEWFNLEQVDQIIRNLSLGFLAQGVKYREKVLILAETRIEWFLCAQAVWRIGATLVTLYTTLGLKSILHGINETEVEHIIITSDLLPMLLKVIDKAERLKFIYVIQLHPGLHKSDPILEDDFNKVIESQKRRIKMINYDELCKIGFLKKESDYDYCRPTPEDIAIILYTSGSTGNPKGVLLTHRNILSGMHAAYSILHQEIIDEYDLHSFYAVLPLAHVFEVVMELAFFGVGIRIGYGSPYTMVDNSTAIMKNQKGDLKMLRPTLMAGVPLLLDRIRRTISDRFERKKSIFWKQLVKFGIAYKNYWIDRGFDTPIVNRFICSRLNGNLGGNVRYIISGGAPLSPDTHRMMKALLNVQILVGYGSTETCAASCLMDFHDLSVGRIGAPLHNVHVRLVDWPEGGYSVHDKPYPRGEIVIGGPSISKGYYKLPEKTAESYEEINGKRWFKTGDIGEVDMIGTFKIIDRKKDLLKLQFGEYISLGKVESELKNFSFVEHVCVYGDSMHTYVIALISPNPSALKHLAKEMGKTDLTTMEQWCNDKEMTAKILMELKLFCDEAGLHKMETPQKIKLCTEEWTPQSGFLTASMKIKRRDVQKFYANAIADLYKSR